MLAPTVSSLASDIPQERQNLAAVGISAWQAGHFLVSGAAGAGGSGFGSGFSFGAGATGGSFSGAAGSLFSRIAGWPSFAEAAMAGEKTRSVVCCRTIGAKITYLTFSTVTPSDARKYRKSS